MKLLNYSLLVAVMVFCSSMGTAFAENRTVPVFMNVEASTVDFVITEKINMTVQSAGNPDLIIDNLVVTNRSQMGLIRLDSIAVTASGDWNLTAHDTDFINMEADQMKFSLVTDGCHDFSQSEHMDIGRSAGPGTSVTVGFEGKTGPATMGIQDVQVARIIATVSLA